MVCAKCAPRPRFAFPTVFRLAKCLPTVFRLTNCLPTVFRLVNLFSTIFFSETNVQEKSVLLSFYILSATQLFSCVQLLFSKAASICFLALAVILNCPVYFYIIHGTSQPPCWRVSLRTNYWAFYACSTSSLPQQRDYADLPTIPDFQGFSRNSATCPGIPEMPPFVSLSCIFRWFGL